MSGLKVSSRLDETVVTCFSVQCQEPPRASRNTHLYRILRGKLASPPQTFVNKRGRNNRKLSLVVQLWRCSLSGLSAWHYIREMGSVRVREKSNLSV